MLQLLIALGSAPTLAANLDFVEVGGPWGSPTSTEATAVWWNPGAVAAGQGHRLYVEGAPTFGSVKFERDDPNGGPYELKSMGTIPFLGLATDFGVNGPGLGLALAVPAARAGHATDPEGPGSYHLQEVDVRTIHLTAAMGWDILDRVSLGVAGHYVIASWEATLAVDSMPDIAAALEEQNLDAGYTDDDLEDPDYAVTMDYAPLQDRALTWSVGTLARPIDRLAIGVSYIAPFQLNHTGTIDMTFSCPPQSDIEGREGAEQFGLCDADGPPVTLLADGTVAYAMPSRLHFGVAFEVIPGMTLEGFGGLVGWGTYQDLAIGIAGIDENNEFDEDPPGGGELTAGFVEQERDWARDANNSFFAGLDLKHQVHDTVTLGGRVLYDKAALSDSALSVNNWDANDVALTVHVAFKPTDALRIGLAYSHHFIATRTVSDSAYAMTLDEDAQAADRYNYPQMNGTYSGSIDRLGVSLAAGF